MRLVNILQIFRYFGVLIGCCFAPMTMARPYVYVEEPLKETPLELALAPTARTHAALLHYMTKPMTMPLLVQMPKAPTRASMLKYAARSNVPQAVTALSMTATASATTQCVTLTYDQNGNRLLQTVTSMVTSPVTWGSGVYGCFVWVP